LTVERTKLEEWRQRFPVDFIAVKTILRNTSAALLSLLYVGACIANTPLG